MDQDIAVLFRYRDLIARTIFEHQAIAHSHGACFWGWWKRPTEGTRHNDVWGFLDSQLTAGTEYAVGLFDSGESDPRKAVRRAWVTEIRQPPSVAGTHWEPVGLEADERELVPPYYRNSPFSRAWLKIVRIDEPFEFFGEYSYDVAPPLPRVPRRELERLRGKVVIDVDELRAMDTTVWRVRRKKASDSTDRVLSSSTRLVVPVCSTPVPVDGKVILHLSDLHFAIGEHRETQHRWKYPEETRNVATLAEAVADSVHTADVGVVLVTGDFTFLADPIEFEHAKHALNTMMGRFNLSTDHLVLIPGNHDLKWTKADTDKHKGDQPTSILPPDARKAYEDFYRSVLLQEPHDHLAMGRRFVFGNGVVVDIAALNSTALEAGKQYLAGMGRVGVGAFRKVRRQMGWETTGGEPSPAIALRILALHHHLVGAEDVENPAEYYTGFGSAIDARGILRDAAQFGVGLAVHGHRHRPFIGRDEVYPLPEYDHKPRSLGTVSIVGAGSAGSRESEGEKNFFNTLEPRPDSLVLRIYCANKQDDHFKPMPTYVARMRFEKGRLALGPWTDDGEE